MLYPTWDVPQEIMEDLNETTERERADGVTPRVIDQVMQLNPVGRPVMANEAETYYQWVVGAVKTPRGRYLAMPRNYGIENMEELFRSDLDPDVKESEAVRRVKECIMQNPRTVRVFVQPRERRGDALFLNIEAETTFGVASFPVRLGGAYE